MRAGSEVKGAPRSGAFIEDPDAADGSPPCAAGRSGTSSLL